MIVTIETYRFAPPDSEDGVIIRGMQEYAADDLQASTYQLEVPDSLQALVSERHQCCDWPEVVKTLATAFCDEDERLATSLINR